MFHRKSKLVAMAAVVAAVITLGVASSDSYDRIEYPKDTGARDPVDLNDRLAAVGERAPSFGGMFLGDDAQGRNVLKVYVTDSDRRAAVRSALTEVMGNDIVPPQGIRYIPGEFHMTQLSRWFDALAPRALTIDAVNMIDLAEHENRIAVGVSDRNGKSEVMRLASLLGIPRSAITVTRLPGIQLYSGDDLTERVRPIAGGLRIDADHLALPCSLGFVTSRNGVDGWVTASHCSEMMFEDDNTVFDQIENQGEIGTELTDPDGECIDVPQCTSEWRYADAAFFEMAPGMAEGSNSDYEIGTIARPTGPGGTTDLYDPDPRFEIVAEGGFPPVGTEVEKVGQTSGWTLGDVDETCAWFEVQDNWLRCQTKVLDPDPATGDSGAPVFEYVSGADDVELHGTLTGGVPGEYYVFSSLGYIYAELGPPSATWDTCVSGC